VQFAQFDKNGDGRITRTEMCEVMTSLGFEVRPNEVDRILRRADSNSTYLQSYCNLPGAATPRGVSSSEVLELGGHRVSIKKPLRFCLNFAGLYIFE